MKLATIPALLLLAFGVLPGGRTFGSELRSPEQTVIDYVAAFSRHEIATVISMTHLDVEWLSVSGSSIKVETRGQEALAASLRSYFESCSTCRSTVSVSAVNGNFVAALETASWKTATAERSQTSLSVYELLDGKVRRVWYYPAAKP